MRIANLLLSLTFSLALTGGAVAETILFQDTFDSPDDVNVNGNLDARQAGGKVVSDYKKYGGESTQSAIAANELKRMGPGGLDLAANFAEHICGKNFSISADTKCLSSEGWGAMSLLSTTAPTRGLSPLSIRLHGGGLVVVSSGRAGDTPPPLETVFSPVQIGKTLGNEFRVADAHNYKFVVTEEGEVDRVAFFIDGVEFPLKCNTVEFGDETRRTINFINVNDAETDIVYDNLKLVTDTAP